MTLKVNELEKDLLAVKKEFGIFKTMAAEVKSSSHCPESSKYEHSGTSERRSCQFHSML